MDSHTVIYGVFGDPVRHSLSPIMLNKAFQAKKINAVYGAFHVHPDDLGKAIDGVRSMGYGGVNVTIPHKEKVMTYLDEIDEGAQVIGAVNTVVHRDGKLYGYNTDGIGYVRSLKEESGFEAEGKTIVMLGAGGASRGVAYALLKEKPAHLYIANRTLARAQSLAESLSSYGSITGMGIEDVGDIMQDAHLLINTTQIGMHPDVDGIPIPDDLLHRNMLVSDIIYNPMHTRLLQSAAACGAAIHTGLGMFIYQGAYAFEYWTNTSAPVAEMRSVVEEALGSTGVKA